MNNLSNIKNKKVAVIIPTYNESKNIKILINDIYKFLPSARIILVDDSNEIENLKIKKNIKNLNVDIISRNKKLGRGSAVIIGFKEALKDKDIKYLFEMDADLSHLPNEIPNFLNKIHETKADLVIGSRYVNSGKTIKWPLWRLVLSKLINQFINLLLGINIKDYTDGYRLYTRKAANFLTKSSFRTSGFILLSESSYKLKLNGFKIIEIPITFVDRKYGKSSMGFKELLQSLYGILIIRIFTKK